ncbi:MAG: riboflavin synthase [Lachnospiraceae bacterium]|jgi:riboflavin synthase|nr:riboflavin synthase [Lachnospiraceae bacterium]
MFTGIVEEIGTIKKVQKGQHSAILSIQAEKILEDLKIGDSVAVNGVCLTATSLDPHGFTADVMHETLDRSSLAYLKSGSHVNLERAMAADGRFGGHIVAGHVDGMGKIQEIRRDDTAIWYTIQAQPSILRYIVEKGSITIDGISLTVARVSAKDFAISAIPHTVQITTLGKRREGDFVNLENDIIGKYVEKLLTPADPKPAQSRLTKDFLLQCGYDL